MRRSSNWKHWQNFPQASHMARSVSIRFGIHFAAILISGASVNPARTLGPAVISNTWTDIWIYFLCPAAGAILGWLVHSVVVEGDIRDDVSHAREEVASEVRGGGLAVSDDDPDPAAPSFGTETEGETKESESE